jgi:GrpB-like predicted nucleotidyltransferase (UPF0157 family)
MFANLRSPLATALSGLAIAIEHVGSTAVPGLAAKPIIDIDVVVPSPADVPEAITRLAALGYTHRGNLGIPGRQAFAAPQGTPPHHLYVCSADSEELSRHRLFRDYLRTYAEVARAYGTLKKALANIHRGDRAAYTDGKSEFIVSVLRQAQLHASDQRELG